MNDWQRSAIEHPFDYRTHVPEPRCYRRHPRRRGGEWTVCLTFERDDVNEYPVWHAGVTDPGNARTDIWPMGAYQEAVAIALSALDGVGQDAKGDKIQRTDHGAHVRRKATLEELEIYAEMTL